MPSLSVIIPSFNCADLLERSVRSTQHLGIKQPEVLIVDDGSTDNTPALCAALAAEIPVVKYLRKSNGGLSSARNYGIERATGAYILLLDSDDELVPCNLGQILETGVDMVRIGVEEVGQSTSSVTYHREDYPAQSGRSYLQNAFERNDFYTPSWAFLYRRDLLLQKQLTFMPGLLHEDNLFTVQALMAAETMIAIPDLVYRYIRRDGSITTAVDRNKLLRRIDAYCLIAHELTRMANADRSFDLRWKVEEVMGGAHHLARQAGGLRPLFNVLFAQLRYMLGYQGLGAPGFRYKQRQDLKHMLKILLARLPTALGMRSDAKF